MDCVKPYELAGLDIHLSRLRTCEQLSSTLREASLPTATRQHPPESIVDFVGGRPIIDLRLANFDLLFCDAYARRVGCRWRKDGLRDAA